MATFVNFIADAAADPALAKEAVQEINNGNSQSLQSFFSKKGYNLSIEECETLIKNAHHIGQEKLTENVRSY
ncbi:hypothetical protein EHO59_00130 [Leptospira semungkisensis]|uniref:Nif11 family protein n=1 Tax=Leptospira semungkisensis TaxID=2484985 RepID=A0A4R9G728_9LEPT|nr:hypothetical protein [Leptospira semungkisensis]TGK06587.1 hypothetical protein EHO59_00130 [Leptospira semungkisensis]